MLSVLLVAGGEAATVTGIAFVSWPAALIVAGVQAVAVGLLRRDRPADES